MFALTTVNTKEIFFEQKKKKREREIFTAERLLEVIHVESSIWIYG